MDAVALSVFVSLDARLFVRADLAVGAGARLEMRIARLAALEASRLARGDAARLHALLDALLVDIALHVRLHALRGRGIRVAGLRVMLLAVDVAAHLVLLARESRFLGRRKLAVLHRARLVALHARLFLLEPRRFARIEAAGLQALLDSLLLVDVALHGPGLSEGGAAERKAERGGGSGGKFHV